jgi:RNA polymerase sigma factor (sigma-70 family)
MSAAPSIPESTATVEAAQAGLLYERYSSRILGYCRNRLSSREEAEDAVQHTFLNAYRSLRTGVVPHAEAAWLFKIAENVCHERRRSAWRRSRIEIVSDDGEMRDAVAAPVHRHDELSGLADALAELTPNQRRAILLREWQGLSYREIAAELETTEAAVETLLFRARRSLARKLDRSRDRILSGLNLGSLVAWGKSLMGGAAAKVAAATVVVAAGVTAATPALRHQVLGGTDAPRAERAAQAPVPPETLARVWDATTLASSAGIAVARSEQLRGAAPVARSAGDPSRSVQTPALGGAEPIAAPLPVTGTEPALNLVPGSLPAPVAEPDPKSLPVVVTVPSLPTVKVPPVPPVPPLPALPPPPPVGVLELPSVLPAPELPKLP